MITHIKPFYEPEEAQDYLRSDALKLIGVNITGNFKRYKKRAMTQKEVDITVKILYDILIDQNDLENDWNQTP